MRYFLRLSYDGTDFHGWQRQPNAPSVQQTIEDALSLMCRRKVDIVGAGRTDAGVHAQVMFAHLDLDYIPDKKRFLTSLNHIVGNAISVYDLLPVVPEAHARFDALSRSYQYFINLKKDPFTFDYSHFMHRCPDIDAMNEASSVLLETEDFTSFAKLHSDTKTNICNVTNAVWNYYTDDAKIVFSVSADRFLRNMVRALVGTLLEVGLGKITLEDFKKIILKKDRCAAGMSVPAKGLFLSDIIYPNEIFLP